MVKNTSSHWPVEWLQSLDGDRLRELCSSYFALIGYQVNPSKSPVLHWILSQDEAMAPDVALHCCSDKEGVEIPALKEIDAAIAINGCAYGIVATNGNFTSEKKMFAQGKPMQLIDAAEFVKKLSQLSEADQEALRIEFKPTPPAPAKLATNRQASESGTPNFIRKLESVPGFGKKPDDALPPKPKPESVSPGNVPAPGSPAPATPTNFPASAAAPPQQPSSLPSIGLNLTQPVNLSSAAPNEASSPAGGLAPLSQLPPLARSEPQDSQSSSGPAPTPVPAASPGPNPTGKLPPLGRMEAGPPRTGVETSQTFSNVNSVPAPGNSTAYAQPAPIQPSSPAPGAPSPGLTPAAPAPQQNKSPGLPLPTATSSSSPATGSAPLPESPQPSPAVLAPGPQGRTPVRSTPPSAVHPAIGSSLPEKIPQGSKAPSFSATTASPGQPGQVAPLSSPSLKRTDAPGADSPAENKGGAQAHLQKMAEASSQAAAIDSVVTAATPPPLPKDRLDGETAASPPLGGRKKLFMIAAAIVLFLAVSAIAGGFILKKLLGGGENTVKVPVEPAPVIATVADPAKLAELALELDHRLTELKDVSDQMDARDAAIQVATIASSALEAQINFVEIGGENVDATVRAVVKGATVTDPGHRLHGKEFRYPDLSEAGQKRASEYLTIEEGLLAFSFTGSGDLKPEFNDKPSASGEELLLELEKILNEQHVTASRDNAKKIASVAAEAKEGGLDFTAKGRRDKAKTIAAIVGGEKVANYMGTGEDVSFGFPDLSKKAQAAAADYLEIKSDSVIYVAEPQAIPEPAFSLRGDNLIKDLEHGISIAEKAVAHVGGRREKIEELANELAAKQESIIALTGKPVEIPFAEGKLAVHLPRDFSYEHEDRETLLIVPKFASYDGAVWVRIKLQDSYDESENGEPAGVAALRALAFARGRPVEELGDKLYYWKKEEYHDGANLYWVNKRYVGFGNTIVVVTDGIVQGMEDLPDSHRLSDVLPGIIESLREMGNRRLGNLTTVPAIGTATPPVTAPAPVEPKEKASTVAGP